MTRALLALLGLAGAAGLMVVVMHQVGAARPVYTVTELRAIAVSTGEELGQHGR